MDPELAELASFAEELGQRARAETLVRFRRGGQVADKATGGLFDPVTEADRAAERAMRQLINERFPTHGISGEEWPDQPGSSNYSWSLDPIDGTRSFICGLPTWTTLIALLDAGVPAVGYVDAPALDEAYVGFEGYAVMVQRGERTRIQASGCRSLAEARVSTTDPALFDAEAGKAFERLRHKARTVRYGHDGYAYARLAAGTLDLVVEAGLRPYDYNALIPLVRAAGGVAGDWRGGQEYAGGKIIAAATQELFDEALGYFEALA
jgi:myo-inositol-1(or 4)-monophosphatase